MVHPIATHALSGVYQGGYAAYVSLRLALFDLRLPAWRFPGLSRGYLVAILSQRKAIEVCILCHYNKE